MKKDQDADTAKRAVVGSSDFVFGIRCLRRVVLARSGIGRQQLSGALELESAGWAENAVVANFGGAARQDVLEEAVKELDSGKRDLPNPMRPIVGVAKTNHAIIDGLDAAIG